VVEEAGVEQLFAAPAHPYTRALIAAQPRMGHVSADGWLATLAGQPADFRTLPTGCTFHPRCPEVMSECHLSSPSLTPLGGSHSVSCWLHSEPSAGGGEE